MAYSQNEDHNGVVQHVVHDTMVPDADTIRVFLTLYFS